MGVELVAIHYFYHNLFGSLFCIILNVGFIFSFIGSRVFLRPLMFDMLVTATRYPYTIILS
jgi:hypothetical protein